MKRKNIIPLIQYSHPEERITKQIREETNNKFYKKLNSLKANKITIKKLSPIRRIQKNYSLPKLNIRLSSINNKEKEKGLDDGSGILFSNISPEEWQRELEKVSSKLKFDYGRINMNGTSEWREHIQQIKEGGDKFTTAIPDSRAVLENLSSEIDKSLDKIMKKEEQLSKNHENIISDYKERHKDRNEQFNEYQQLNEQVDEMRREVEDVNDKIAQANEKYDNLSKKISDTSKVGNQYYNFMEEDQAELYNELKDQVEKSEKKI